MKEIQSDNLQIKYTALRNAGKDFYSPYNITSQK